MLLLRGLACMIHDEPSRLHADVLSTETLTLGYAPVSAPCRLRARLPPLCRQATDGLAALRGVRAAGAAACGGEPVPLCICCSDAGVARDWTHPRPSELYPSPRAALHHVQPAVLKQAARAVRASGTAH